jgi:hypothetical protein
MQPMSTWKPKLGHYKWVTTAKVGIDKAEALYCGEAHVADIWVGSHGIGWQIFAVPELGLDPAAGLDGADLDRPAWSSQGFEATRKAVNDRVRSASPTAKNSQGHDQRSGI